MLLCKSQNLDAVCRRKLRHKYCIGFFVLFFVFASCTSQRIGTRSVVSDDSFIAATYNIRYVGSKDDETGNGWDIRKSHVGDVILNHKMDIVGTQEGSDEQLTDLKLLLEEYEYYAHPYGGKDGTLHNAAIFYKTSMFTLLDSGVFWLSPTPTKPSYGWDATDRRICQWGKFLHKPSGKTFYFFNAHFYWRGRTAKEQSGFVIVEKMKSIAGDNPVLLVGDINSGSDSFQIKKIKEVLSDAYDSESNLYKGIQETAFPGGVFQGKPNVRIDYLFMSNHFDVEYYKVGTDVYRNGNGEETYPSDHLPVITRFKLNKD